jgi:hypothetical protein
MINIGLLFLITMIFISIQLKRKINYILRVAIMESLSLNKQLNKIETIKKNKEKDNITSKKIFKLKKNNLKPKLKKNKKSKYKNENKSSNKKLKNNNNINNKSNIKKLCKKSLCINDENSNQIIYIKDDTNTLNEKVILKNSPYQSKKKLKNKNVNEIFLFSNKNNRKSYLKNKKTKATEDEKIKYSDKIIDLVTKDKRYKYFVDDELNSLEYKYALEIDTRSFFQIYISLLKQNHLIIFTFCVKNDYNIFFLKFGLFLINFSLFLFMNALFFEDDSLHKIYEDQGKYDFLYQIPQILYSTISSQIISSLLEKLSLSQDEILSIKEKNNLKEINKEIKNIHKCILRKYVLFFIVSIVLLFAFWYYLSAFCAVYYNTQIPLIKNNISSFATSMIYPFFLELIPVIFRIISLRYKIKCQYILSKIVIKIIEIM